MAIMRQHTVTHAACNVVPPHTHTRVQVHLPHAHDKSRDTNVVQRAKASANRLMPCSPMSQSDSRSTARLVLLMQPARASHPSCAK